MPEAYPILDRATTVWYLATTFMPNVSDNTRRGVALLSSVESMRPSRARERRRSRPNAIANLLQTLKANCGNPWNEVKKAIYDHPKHRNRRTRPIVRERLDALVCTSKRPVNDHHVFVVRDGILELASDLSVN